MPKFTPMIRSMVDRPVEVVEVISISRAITVMMKIEVEVNTACLATSCEV